MASRRTRERNSLTQKAETRRHKINADFARRHPERAREERQFRQQQAALGPDWQHKREGTPETHAAAARTVQGALARLYLGGAIDADQLAWAAEIAQVHAQITRDVVPATVSLETRIDAGRGGEQIFYEALGRVRAEIAYSRWRRGLPRPGAVLAMIADDVAVSVAARRFGMRPSTAKALLVTALDAWPDAMGAARRAVDAADLAAAQDGLI